jgi:hypothetical protein
VRHGWRIAAGFQGFSWFQTTQAAIESYSSAHENGINKKRLPHLNSVVNLCEL